jgi:hypothetical protein
MGGILIDTGPICAMVVLNPALTLMYQDGICITER